MSYTQFILLLCVWDAILGLCLIQNKTKQNRTPSQNSHRLGPVSCALHQASGLSSLLAVGRVEEGDGEEERDPEGGGGVPRAQLFEWGWGSQLAYLLKWPPTSWELVEIGWVSFLRSERLHHPPPPQGTGLLLGM